VRFGPVPLAEAEGAVLAHSIGLPDGKLKKGRRLSRADLDRLEAAGETEVTVARLDAGDVDEDTAAARVAAALAPDPKALGLSVSAPFTGRANLFAAEAGVLTVDAGRVDALNALDESLTLATLDRHARVAPRQMVATVKVIPYAAPAEAVARAEAILADGPVLRVHPLARRTAGLILTAVPGMSEKALAKGAEAVRARVKALGMELAAERRVAHRTEDVAAAIRGCPGEMILILTGSATSDRDDVGPAGLVAAGGRLARFGMPVDPGNLLFLGRFAEGRPVIGLPGCAKSPKLNGADWVLERLACGIGVGAEEIAAMGVGGLLKEIPSRPAPRAGGGAKTATEPPRRPIVSALVLAAGTARRMQGRDKLMEEVGGRPVLAHVAREAAASAADETVAVLREGDAARAAALGGTGARIAENRRAGEGMGTSIAAGLAALREDADAVLILMGDMPEIRARDIDRLIAAFDPEENRAIVRATSEDGRPGHPVLFGRRFFEALAALGGDSGARQVIRENAEFLVEVALPGRAALTDLDTPEAWEAWRRGDPLPA
jgi:molybdenum cofactor cytidylyltransferase